MLVIPGYVLNQIYTPLPSNQGSTQILYARHPYAILNKINPLFSHNLKTVRYGKPGLK